MRDHIGCRRETRLGFADAPRAIRLPTLLRDIRLDSINFVDLSSLTGSTSFDLFSLSLRILSYNLRKMQMHAVADRMLFWPDDDGVTPFWLNLELLTVLFQFCSPKGDWYFDAPVADSGDEDEDRTSYTTKEKIRLQIRFNKIKAALTDPKNAKTSWHPDLNAQDEKWDTEGRHEDFITRWEGQLRTQYCLAKRKDTEISQRIPVEVTYRAY
ncbi:uncharacterized protein CC84DRAFT_1172047 [Paraphaeosphaeria sporulosa]|uniref:Uncharacterized protein n=1 Tax=Paraphaeosphaeria sporulosa TaxID=1460663 RepID=A0A177CPM6_9PLEO|nr:uncharacterized protein CC84DRAFT_1172047 [Paraphaeosphaeria sporulosa]OAG09475.1 hypothetical protein CC84DRAFT_1172047 [Paraphaeosphaeria sporulosa]